MKTKILVVDDEPAISDLLQMFLTREGYEVAVALAHSCYYAHSKK